MTLDSILADLVVAAIVLACLWRAIRELTPALHRRIVSIVRRLAGMPLAAKPATTAGCDSGCGPCTGCGRSQAATTTSEQPLSFQPPKR